MPLSIQKCWEIVFLHLHKLGPNLSLKTIAKELHYSPTTVKKWINQYQETGDIQDQEGRGPKRKTSDKENTDIVTVAKRLRTSTSTEISTLINKQGTDISPRTIRHRLNEQGFIKLQPLCKPLLSDRHRENQLKWANSNKKRDWSNVIFTDEVTFSQFGKPKKVW